MIEGFRRPSPDILSEIGLSMMRIWVKFSQWFQFIIFIGLIDIKHPNYLVASRYIELISSVKITNGNLAVLKLNDCLTNTDICPMDDAIVLNNNLPLRYIKSLLCVIVPPGHITTKRVAVFSMNMRKMWCVDLSTFENHWFSATWAHNL